MVRTNQHLLSALGVSHASLDRICAVVDDTVGDAVVANACVVLRLSKHSNAYLQAMRGRILRALQAAQRPWKFTYAQSSVGGDGVLWLRRRTFSADETYPRLRSVVSLWARYAAVAVVVASTATASGRRSTTVRR
jgi:hypothetical protein